jgi:hypothetical protein
LSEVKISGSLQKVAQEIRVCPVVPALLAAYIGRTIMLLLVLHESGIGWDEAVMMFGGLAALTGALVMFLRRQEPVTEEAVVEQPRVAAPRAPRRRRR